MGTAVWATTGCQSSAPPARSAAAPPTAPTSDPRWQRVVEAFDRTLEASVTPGGAIGIVLDGKPAFTAGRGVRKCGTSALVTPSTLFRTESVTKTFTALAALSLVEQKRLDLDAPIADLVPSVVFAEPAAGRDVTLRRLLTHTAGLARNPIRKLLDVRRGFEYEDLFAKNPLTLGPPDRFVYSNTGYLLVGAAIERAAKASFDDVSKKSVLTPLGMTHATMDGAVAAMHEHADGHGAGEEGRAHAFDPGSLDAYVQRPVGGLHASIDELALFVARLMAFVPSVLRRETFDAMTTKHTTTDEPNVWYGYGLYGVDSPRGPVWTHTGAGRGSTGYFLCAPRERFGIVAVTNNAHYEGWRDVRRTAEEAFLGAPLF